LEFKYHLFSLSVMPIALPLTQSIKSRTTGQLNNALDHQNCCFLPIKRAFFGDRVQKELLSLVSCNLCCTRSMSAQVLLSGSSEFHFCTGPPRHPSGAVPEMILFQ
jgi:hypothetical protein